MALRTRDEPRAARWSSRRRAAGGPTRSGAEVRLVESEAVRVGAVDSQSIDEGHVSPGVRTSVVREAQHCHVRAVPGPDWPTPNATARALRLAPRHDLAGFSNTKFPPAR